MIRSKRIIVAPLNWGLGHATRCIPIIDQLLENDNTIAIATEGDSLSLLKKEYPQLIFFELPPYNITYPSSSMIYNMISQSINIARAVRAERKEASRIFDFWRPDIIISDNRLGFRDKNVYNIYVTHQLYIPSPNPVIRFLANKTHHYFISNFQLCWIPDYEGEKALAGYMSQQPSPIPKKYIGPISRMQYSELEKENDIIVVLSGPEPQRTILEKSITEVLKDTTYDTIIVRGTNATSSLDLNSYNQVFNLLDGNTLNQLILKSHLVIGRSGYSSIMDLEILKSKAVLIPTPGQYEQEYLAQRLGLNERYRSVKQKDIPDRLLDLVKDLF